VIFWLVSLMDDSRPSVRQACRAHPSWNEVHFGEGEDGEHVYRCRHDFLGDVIVTVLSGPEFLMSEAFSDLESLTATGLSDLKDEARLIFPRPAASDAPARQ
jgi:hypothetical protein